MGLVQGFGYLIYYFYGVLLPFLVKYIGIPLFVGGCLLALGFSGGIFITIIAGVVLYYKYIKKVSIINPLTLAKKELIK